MLSNFIGKKSFRERQRQQLSAQFIKGKLSLSGEATSNSQRRDHPVQLVLAICWTDGLNMISQSGHVP